MLNAEDTLSSFDPSPVEPDELVCKSYRLWLASYTYVADRLLVSNKQHIILNQLYILF